MILWHPDCIPTYTDSLSVACPSLLNSLGVPVIPSKISNLLTLRTQFNIKVVRHTFKSIDLSKQPRIQPPQDNIEVRYLVAQIFHLSKEIKCSADPLISVPLKVRISILTKHYQSSILC